jgi:hypothetical protein
MDPITNTVKQAFIALQVLLGINSIFYMLFEMIWMTANIALEARQPPRGPDEGIGIVEG